MTEAVSAIFFDLFSTLISVSKAVGDRGRHTADVLGIDRNLWNSACFSEHHDICRPTSQREIIQRLAHSLDPGIPMPLIEEATEERQWRFDHALLNIEDEILEILGKLKHDGFRLGLISNASTDEVRAWPASPLSRLFDVALFSCHCGISKPDPGIYFRALNEMHVAPGQALFVGDGRSREHLGASHAGIRSLLVTYFIEEPDEDDMSRRSEGSSGQISHIRELYDHI